MRIAIPSEIVKKFGIYPETHQFGWIIQKAKDKNLITITGKFLTNKDANKNNIN